MSANRAERRLCKKAHHPYAKRMEDGSLVCLMCDVQLRPPGSARTASTERDA